jgi:Na+/H+-dicarboxylate symporter
LLEIINDGGVHILKLLTNLLPFAVFGYVVKFIIDEGFDKFGIETSSYIIVVLVALFIQFLYYMILLKLNSWVKPQSFLEHGKEGFINAFGTASGYNSRNSTFSALHNIGLSKLSAGLGAFLIQPVNKDGTSLLFAISTLFISVLQNQRLNWAHLFVVIIASVFVSICTTGIPNAGLVTMTLVISSLNIFGIQLSIENIALLSTVYWLLGSFSTVINVMGNMTIAAIIDSKNKSPEKQEPLFSTSMTEIPEI